MTALGQLLAAGGLFTALLFTRDHVTHGRRLRSGSFLVFLISLLNKPQSFHKPPLLPPLPAVHPLGMG